MPFISLITGGVDFTGLSVKIAGTEAAPVMLTYGKFIQATIDFLIIAAVIFVMVRMISKMQKPTDAPATTKECPRCKMSLNIAATRCPHCTSDISFSQDGFLAAPVGAAASCFMLHPAPLPKTLLNYLGLLFLYSFDRPPSLSPEVGLGILHP